MRAFWCVALGLAAVQAASIQSSASENPIRRIVNLLQKMNEEVAAEQKKDDEMHAKFTCYCEKSDGELAGSTDELRNKIPQIEASIKEAEGAKAQLDQDLAQHKKDREDAKAAIASASAQREKEAAAFADESGELSANIAACKKAIAAIRKGMAGSFLQSDAAVALRKIASESSRLDRYSRGVLVEFLSTSGKAEYAPASGEIVGILSQLLEDMEKELSDATAEENAAIQEFEGLVGAKEKEIAANTEAIEAKLARAGETAVQVVNLKNDLEDAQDSLAEDEKFLADLKKDCVVKSKEYDERKASRAEETVAIAETVKVLNDDDALDLFKKTLPSPSLLQTMSTDRDVRDSALSALSDGFDKVRSPQVSFIEAALLGKKVSFDKILKMIDDLVVVLKEEQKDDDKQREWCLKEFDSSEDKEKDTQRKLDNLATQIDETTNAIATLKDDIAALTKGIEDLDAMVAESTATRKEEHAAYTETSAQNTAALQLLGVAKNRLNKFYNPALYKAPPKRELTEEERIYVASGGKLDPTPAPGGIAGTGITVFAQARAISADGVAPPPPPATGDAYKKRDSSGPIALIDSLAKDLEKDMQANEFDEKQAQKDYEELMEESAAKRAADSKTINEKESQKAGLEGDLDAAKTSQKETAAELLATREYIAQLHGSCDFLLDNFDLRKEARASEIDSLGKAKAVLSGADYSFAQVKTFLSRTH